MTSETGQNYRYLFEKTPEVHPLAYMSYTERNFRVIHTQKLLFRGQNCLAHNEENVKIIG